MTDFNESVDKAKDALNLEDKDMKKLPQMLNVLTILTYIGCGLGALMIILGFIGVGFLSSLAPKSAAGSEALSKVSSNATISMVIGLVGIALCFFGAMKMRNLQKQGFFIYVAGQVIPIVATFVISGVTFGVVGVIIPLVFIILYGTQLKELK